MNSPVHLRHPRHYGNLILVGIVLAVFLYLILVVLLPFVVGPWALLAAALIALPFLFHLHRGHRAIRRTALYKPLPQRSPFGPRRGYYLERAVAALFVVTVVVVLLIVVGNVLWAAYGLRVDTTALAAIGYGLAQAGIWILIGLYDEARWPLNVEYFSEVDTTEDH